MRQVTRKGLITVAAAGGVLAMSGGYSYAADATGSASGSPGVASGNTVQVPVDVPVNACGNTVDVVGLLNPAMGNSCANESGGSKAGSGSGGGATATGKSTGSPGVLSGNTVQAPVHAPVNACGNSVNVVGLLNPTAGNDCSNDAVPSTPDTPETPETPVTPETPDEDRVTEAEPNEPETQLVAAEPTAQLAETGSELPIGAAVPLAAGLLLGGAVLYRKSRRAA
ncbi:hypothetical protein DSC45_09295 [Streptomyces sp. YIM 130001]|uniref:chaplin n=1 Tax=Streptomyces sp. YIM 130001 TaxID=2259644 RepID=UPI000E64E18E|nr:chaplin [Streptomyces sp. YIM 130001]RII18804.1 hypothetical protein DSC45_09295 [Streptomyces sp. YIM 130001]